MKAFFLIGIIATFPLGQGGTCIPTVLAEEALPLVLYVSPQGGDTGTGSREHPLRSPKDAIRRLSASGGKVKLLPGVYRDPVRVDASSSQATLVIEGEKGVIFDGGKDLSDWQEIEGQPGLYFAQAQANELINLWAPSQRFRYLKEIDENGVKGWAGSFCRLEDGRILIHTPDRKAPVPLRRNDAVTGIEIIRNHTKISGIHFKDYLGDKAASAISIQKAKDVEIIDCTIENAIRGVAADKTARDLQVKNCVITDVGAGIHFSGIGLEAIDCTLLAAAGDFAIREEIDYDLFNGIRFYHPAEKGLIRGCITAGFWTGLYQKTSIGFDGPKPFICEGNLFLDGVQSITSAQKGNRYVGNLIFGGILNLSRPESQNAIVQENLVFNFAKTTPRHHGDRNRLESNPFTDLPEGNLTPAPNAIFPDAASKALDSLADRGVHWTAEIAALLATRCRAKETPETLMLVGEPTCASSAKGAVVTARLNAPASGILRFRRPGEQKWRTLSGKESRLSSASALAAIENVTDVEDDERPQPFYAIVFPLLSGELIPEAEYEYQLEFKRGKTEHLLTGPTRFHTRGGPKELVAKKGTTGLQEALDRALPGDTVILEQGVHSFPAILSHGGTADAPITIRGTGSGAILDAGRRHQSMLELHNATHVTLENLQVRLFERAGIVASNSSHLIFRNCRFQNKAVAHDGFTKGTGIMLKGSPDCVIEKSVFTRLLYGVQANDSPRLTVKHNTAFKNLFSSILLRDSAQGSRVTHNSFTFTGNISIYFIEKDPAAFQSLVCDYNNYATTIRPIGETAARAYAGANVKLPSHMEQIPPPSERYGRLSGSKRIIDYIAQGDRKRFFSMEAWRKFSGKDLHSIYADPLYADPLNGDFRVLPESPNIMSSQMVMGAEAIKQ